MRSFGLILFAAALVMFSRPGFGQDKQPRAALASSVQVKLPAGDVEIEYVESKEGMVLIVNSKGASVQAQRVYLGDGKIAVVFEASHKGFFTPNGPVNAAAIDFKEGSVIKVARGKREVWGAKPGEVYVLTPGIRFEVQKE